MSAQWDEAVCKSKVQKCKIYTIKIEITFFKDKFVQSVQLYSYVTNIW